MMNHRQQRFALEYLVDLNATRAAIRAGYSRRSARDTGSRLLTNPDIQTEIARLRAEQAAETKLTIARVDAALDKLAFTDLPEILALKGGRLTMQDFVNLTPAPKACLKKVRIKTIGMTTDDAGNQIPLMSVEIELHDKLKALELIGRRLGAYTDRPQRKVATITFNMNVGSETS